MPINSPIRALGVIPARGGSKGVPRKNIRLLAGKPLIAYTIEAARSSRLLTDVVTSTEDNEIAGIAAQFGSPILMRPPQLAQDSTPTIPVVLNVLEEFATAGKSFDYLVLLQPTAPFRVGEDIDACLDLIHTSGADSVISVSPVPAHYHPDWQFLIDEQQLKLYNGRPLASLIPRRQMLSDTYSRNGAVYACRVEVLLRDRTFYGQDSRAYVMPEQRSINIDSEMDLMIADMLLTRSGV